MNENKTIKIIGIPICKIGNSPFLIILTIKSKPWQGLSGLTVSKTCTIFIKLKLNINILLHYNNNI